MVGKACFLLFSHSLLLHTALKEVLKSTYTGYTQFCRNTENMTISNKITTEHFRSLKARLSLLYEYFSFNPSLTFEQQKSLLDRNASDLLAMATKSDSSAGRGFIGLLKSTGSTMISYVTGSNSTSNRPTTVSPKLNDVSDALFLKKLFTMLDEFPVLLDLAKAARQVAQQHIETLIEEKVQSEADRMHNRAAQRHESDLKSTLVMQRNEYLTRTRHELITAFNTRFNKQSLK